MIKVIVADDHELMREGVKKILHRQQHIQVVGEAAIAVQFDEIREQALDVVERLPRRTPRVVLPDEREDWRGHAVEVGDGRTLRDEVGELVDAPAEECAVVGLQRGRRIVVGRDVVADGDARDDGLPAVGPRPGAEQPEVAAPRPTREDDAVGIGEAARAYAESFDIARVQR